MVSEIEFGGLVFVVNLPARWAHFILVLTPVAKYTFQFR